MPRGRFGIGERDAQRLSEVHRAVEKLGFAYSHVEFPEKGKVRLFFKLPAHFNGMAPGEVDNLKHRPVREVVGSEKPAMVKQHEVLRRFEDEICMWAAGRVQRIYHTTLPRGLHAAVELKSLYNAEKDLLEGLEAAREVK